MLQHAKPNLSSVLHLQHHAFGQTRPAFIEPCGPPRRPHPVESSLGLIFTSKSWDAAHLPRRNFFTPLCPSGPFSSFLAFFSHRTAFCLFLLASSFPIRVDRISISSCTLSSSGLDLRFIFGLFLQACAWVVTKQGWSEYGSRSPSRERSLHKW